VAASRQQANKGLDWITGSDLCNRWKKEDEIQKEEEIKMPVSACLPTFYSTAFISFHLCVNFVSNLT